MPIYRPVERHAEQAPALRERFYHWMFDVQNDKTFYG